MAFKIIRNDITKVAADAIVNTANPDPVYGGGTDSAIYEAAGAGKLLAERRRIGRMEVGQAASTPAFKLKAKYIIHTVGPVWDGGDKGELDDLRRCYVNSLNLADELGCVSIAFPLISTGVYGFPKDRALQTAISVFSEFLLTHEMEIILVVFDKRSFEVSGQIFAGIDAFIDENYVSDQLFEEYGYFGSAARRRDGQRGYADGLPADGRYNRKTGYPEDSHTVGSAMPGSSAMPISSNKMSATGPKHGFSISNRRKKSEAAAFDEARICEEPEEFDFCAAEPAGFPEDQDDVPAEPMMSMSMAAPSSPKSIDEAVSRISDTWQESLLHMIDEKGYTDVDVYKRANVDRKLFSKIRSNKDYRPKKITAVAFALALNLNLDDTKDMLARAGYALSPSSKFDLIIEYFINNEVFDTYTINLALFEHGQPLLGE